MPRCGKVPGRQGTNIHSQGAEGGDVSHIKGQIPIRSAMWGAFATNVQNSAAGVFARPAKKQERAVVETALNPNPLEGFVT